MADTYYRLYRCESVMHYEGQLMQNVVHAMTTSPTVVASQVALVVAQYFLREIMKVQNFNVTYERLLVYSLGEEFVDMYDLDMEAEHPATDVLNLPSMVAWKWTSRNLAQNRNTIGGFYLGGLRSIDFQANGQLTFGGLEAAKVLRDNIINKLGVGGSQPVRLGTYSRTLKLRNPSTPYHDCFFAWANLNFNYRYTSMRKRVPGIGI